MTERLDPVYVAARTVLLDALEALAPYRSAIVLVGAQAVYLQTGGAGLVAAPFTRDGDLALDPAVVLTVHDPLLDAAMTAAGFTLRTRAGGGVAPGTWLKTTDITGAPLQVPVDLIIPRGAMPGAGRQTRGARLGEHGRTTAMLTRGLEGALVDHQTTPVTGLDANDSRTVDVEVAGVGALLVAKLIKLSERTQGRPDRLKDKDAGDIYRLIRTTPAPAMAARLRLLSEHPTSATVTAEALEALPTLFGTARAVGVQMAIHATSQDVPEVRVATQLVSYTAQLRDALAAPPPQG